MTGTRRLDPRAKTDSEDGKGVRVDLGGGEDGKPNKSTWLQNADATGATSVRPRAGDQVVVLSPNGDHEQGVVHPFDHSDDPKNPAPDGETSVLWNRDDVNISIKGGVCTIVAKKIVLKSGEASYTLDGNHTFKDGKIKHDDKNIGKNHVHPGIARGPSKTDPPDS